MTAPQSRKSSKPVIFLASSATEDAEKNNLLLCTCWLWQSCSRRDGAREGEGEMEETTEKKVDKLQGTFWEGRKDEEGERPYYLYFPYNINFSKMKFFWKCLYGLYRFSIR